MLPGSTGKFQFPLFLFLTVNWYQGVCCSDGIHCCPHNTICDVTHQKCVKNEAWVNLREPKPKKPDTFGLAFNRPEERMRLRGGQIICPDPSYQCADNTTCCLLSSGVYGCCPYPKVKSNNFSRDRVLAIILPLYRPYAALMATIAAHLDSLVIPSISAVSQLNLHLEKAFWGKHLMKPVMSLLIKNSFPGQRKWPLKKRATWAIKCALIILLSARMVSFFLLVSTNKAFLLYFRHNMLPNARWIVWLLSLCQCNLLQRSFALLSSRLHMWYGSPAMRSVSNQQANFARALRNNRGYFQ